MTPETTRYLFLAAILFALGAIGFLTRRNLILMVLSGELMLHGVSLTLVTFSRMHANFQGQVFTIMILTVAACEAGLSLTLILVLYQQTKSLDVRLWTRLREEDLPQPEPNEEGLPEPVPPAPPVGPRLTPSGRPLTAPSATRTSVLATAAQSEEVASHV